MSKHEFASGGPIVTGGQRAPPLRRNNVPRQIIRKCLAGFCLYTNNIIPGAT
jgi:hypothetical protein